MVCDPEGRFIVLQIELGEEVLTLINIYAPTQLEGIEQALFFERLNNVVDDLEVSDIFMGGDFNIHIPRNSETPEGNIRPSSHRATYIARIHAFLNQYNISDVRIHNINSTRKPW